MPIILLYYVAVVTMEERGWTDGQRQFFVWHGSQNLCQTVKVKEYREGKILQSTHFSFTIGPSFLQVLIEQESQLATCRKLLDFTDVKLPSRLHPDNKFLIEIVRENSSWKPPSFLVLESKQVWVKMHLNSHQNKKNVDCICEVYSSHS